LNVDRSVFSGYGWPEGIGGEDIIKNRLALDPERSAQVRLSLVRPRVGLPDTPAVPDHEEHVGRIVTPALRPAQGD
jgi:hypothetical protein